MNSTGPCNETIANGSCVNETSSASGNSRLNESLWDLPASPAVAGVIATLYMVIFLVAFSWNLFVIVFMLKNRKLLKHPSSIFLFCLVIVDFMEAISSIPFYIATLIGGGWIFGDTDDMRMDFCMAVGFFLSMFLTGSVHILAIIAFDRFLYIALPLSYHRLLKPWKAWLLVFVCCIPAVIVASTPLYGFGEFFFFNDFGVCLFHWRGETQYVILFCLENMIPIVCIVVFTALTYWYVRRYLRKREKREVHYSNMNLNSIENIHAATSRSEEERVIKEHQARRKTLTRLFIALIVTQLVCFTPALVTAFVGSAILGSFDKVPNVIFFIDFVFVISNAAINPIILTCIRRSIRQKLVTMVKKVWRIVTCRCGRVDNDLERTWQRPSYARQATTETVLNVRLHKDSIQRMHQVVKKEVSDSGNSSAGSDPLPCDYTGYPSPEERKPGDYFTYPSGTRAEADNYRSPTQTVELHDVYHSPARTDPKLHTEGQTHDTAHTSVSREQELQREGELQGAFRPPLRRERTLDGVYNSSSGEGEKLHGTRHPRTHSESEVGSYHRPAATRRKLELRRSMPVQCRSPTHPDTKIHGSYNYLPMLAETERSDSYHSPTHSDTFRYPSPTRAETGSYRLPSVGGTESTV